MGRRFGQHFLSRKSILDRIAEAACGERVARVIEIGPGKGALTESLLERSDKVADPLPKVVVTAARPLDRRAPVDRRQIQ